MRALILAGGSGTRFWPLSRQLRPKQLLALEGERSLLQDTVARLAPLVVQRDVWVCTTEALAGAVRQQLPDVPAGQVLCEPTGRNTAPAIGWSVRSMGLAQGDDDTVAVLPADHRVGDAAAFRAALAQAAEVVQRDSRVMTLGVTPRWAETGYGYLELDAEPGPDGVRRVRRFVEKPNAADAARYAASGRHLWNAGIFVFRGRAFLDVLARVTPDLSRGLDAIAASPERLAAIYPTLPSESIDYAVMEKLDDLLTLPLDCGWSDLGSWEALAEVLPGDADGNTRRGDTLALDARGNLLFADAGTIAVLGVEDLVVVRTGDAVLVLPKARSQEVKRLVADLAASRRTDLL
ncbi:MAG TPA: sugar phosphate nucleotidyltransferase [Thermoanaerobaculia bacterium]